MTQSEPAVPSPTEIPNAARIYNYMLGGSHWVPADQAAAEYMKSLVPSTPKWVNMLRDFLHQAGRDLHAQGFRHFVDFASGLPADDHIHAAVPGAKVVYSDVDPYTLRVAREMVAGTPDVLYLEHDVRDARGLLERPEVTEFLGGERRLALGLSGVTVFLPPDEIRRVLHELYDWAAPGSRLYITWETRMPGQMTPPLQQFLDIFEQTGSPFYLYTRDEAMEMCAPWRLPEGGLPTLAGVLGLPSGHITDEDREGVGLEFYAGILEKP